MQHGASVRIRLGFDEIKVVVPRKDAWTLAATSFLSSSLMQVTFLIVANVVVLLCASVLARLRSLPRHG